jgi:glucose-6-phosphate isomerase
VTFQLDRLDERAVGALYFAFCALTAVTGALLKVNPFDQPGVEEGKVYIRQSLQAGKEQSTRDEDAESAVQRLRPSRD